MFVCLAVCSPQSSTLSLLSRAAQMQRRLPFLAPVGVFAAATNVNLDSCQSESDRQWFQVDVCWGPMDPDLASVWGEAWGNASCGGMYSPRQQALQSPNVNATLLASTRRCANMRPRSSSWLWRSNGICVVFGWYSGGIRWYSGCFYGIRLLGSRQNFGIFHTGGLSASAQATLGIILIQFTPGFGTTAFLPRRVLKFYHDCF